MSEIKIYSKLKSYTSDGILTETDQIKDINLDKFQSELNKTLNEDNKKLGDHLINKNNPHEVTKSQIGLGSVTNDAQVKRTEMGKANGVATLDSNGLIPSSQLPSYVDDVIECYAQYETSNIGEITGIKLFKTKTPKPNGQEGFNYSDEITTGEAGKIYVDLDSGRQFRWSGNSFIHLNSGSSIIIGEITGTAYDGKKGYDTTTKVNSHTNNTSNPHNVTKSQIGLSNVDNTSDLDKPISSLTKTALGDKVDKTITINNHALNSNITLTPGDLNLGNVDNTSDLDKPISTAIQTELDSLYDILYNQASNVNLLSDYLIIEKGISTPITLNWDYTFNDKSQKPESMELSSEGKVLISDLNTKTYSDSITTSKSYKVTATNHNITKSDLVIIEAFYPKFYGGLSKTSITESDILGLNKQPISNTAVGYAEFEIKENDYIWICIPEEMSIKKIISDGFKVPFNNEILIQVNGKCKYKCYRSIHKFKAGTFSCNILDDNSETRTQLAEFDQLELEFTNNIKNNIIEKGINTEITLLWNCIINGFDKIPEKLELKSNDHVLIDNPKLNTYTEIINDTKSYRLIVTNNNITRYKTATINSYYPKYYGSSSKLTLTESDVLAMEKQPISSNASGRNSFKVEDNNYIWFCIPENMDIYEVFANGFEIPLESPQTLLISGKGNYKCYRSTKSFKAGLFKCEIN